MSLETAFPAVRERRVFTFADGLPADCSPPRHDTSARDLSHRRAQAAAEEWGGSLGDILAQRREAPSPRRHPNMDAPQVATYATSRIESASTNVEGSSLSDVFPPVVTSLRAPPPSLPLAMPSAHSFSGRGQLAPERTPSGMEIQLSPSTSASDLSSGPPAEASSSLVALLALGADVRAAQLALARHGGSVHAAADALLCELEGTSDNEGRDESPGLRLANAGSGTAAAAIASDDGWGGSLSEVLRSGRRRLPTSRTHLASSPPHGPSSRRAPPPPHTLPTPHTPPSRFADGDDYVELMRMHLEDNVLPARAPSEWRQLLRLFRTARASNGECCSVCLESLSCASQPAGNAAAVCRLPCGHFFHRECITQCVRQQHWACPNCRDDLLERLKRS